jgi:hypothetical protein
LRIIQASIRVSNPSRRSYLRFFLGEATKNSQQRSAVPWTGKLSRVKRGRAGAPPHQPRARRFACLFLPFIALVGPGLSSCPRSLPSFSPPLSLSLYHPIPSPPRRALRPAGPFSLPYLYHQPFFSNSILSLQFLLIPIPSLSSPKPHSLRVCVSSLGERGSEEGGRARCKAGAGWPSRR